MPVTVNVVQGANNVPYDFVIVDNNNNAVDLSNTSANQFKMRPLGSLIDTVNNTSTTIQSATGGVIRYTFQQLDLANSNLSGYLAEIDLNYQSGNVSGRIVPVTGITVVVQPSAPGAA